MRHIGYQSGCKGNAAQIVKMSVPWKIIDWVVWKVLWLPSSAFNVFPELFQSLIIFDKINPKQVYSQAEVFKKWRAKAGETAGKRR
jgi:hypothetical protein